MWGIKPRLGRDAYIFVSFVINCWQDTLRFFFHSSHESFQVCPGVCWWLLSCISRRVNPLERWKCDNKKEMIAAYKETILKLGLIVVCEAFQGINTNFTRFKGRQPRWIKIVSEAVVRMCLSVTGYIISVIISLISSAVLSSLRDLDLSIKLLSLFLIVKVITLITFYNNHEKKTNPDGQ